MYGPNVNKIIGELLMSLDPDRALETARGSIHGFHMDGPTQAELRAELRIEHLERVVSSLFKQERKLKLERLMFKACFMSEVANTSIGYTQVQRDYFENRGKRWRSLVLACKKELYKL